MKTFWNRKGEQERLRAFLAAPGGGLAIVYGRRRCGKSTLLQRVLDRKAVYFQADQREAPLQMQSVLKALSPVLPDFDRASFADWDDLLAALYARTTKRLCVCLDEFPYLVQGAPELPSVLQRYVDRPDGQIKWILCGSSQRMMQGLVLDRTAPLYGRATQIVKLEPLSAGWLTHALDLTPADAVESYAVWGGIPRYWELASEHKDTESALKTLVWERFGVLHDEPQRLLLDDMRGAVQLYSVMSLIGAGCHRVSEIAGRLGKPMPSLMRPLAQLCELGYVRRDVPFGENPKNSKRSLYRLRDPFLRFYFKFVLPYESALAQGLVAEAQHAWRAARVHHVAACWEELSRLSAPWIWSGQRWGVASSWWGGAGGPVEVDVVALSLDGKELLVGECKWAEKTAAVDVAKLASMLRAKAATIPDAKGRRIVPACWLGGGATAHGHIECLFHPKEVMTALER
jgi:AAA+ ATPase superfamily predicted ATPase